MNASFIESVHCSCMTICHDFSWREGIFANRKTVKKPYNEVSFLQFLVYVKLLKDGHLFSSKLDIFNDLG